MTIAISGIEGNLASHIAALAAEPIIGIGRNCWHTLDDQLENSGQVGAIIHAAHDFKTQSGDAPTLWINSNLSTTARLLEATRAYGIGTFCYISSSAVYLTDGWARADFDLESVKCPRYGGGTYAEVKRMNEVLIEDFCERNGIRWVSCRVFNLFGGTDQHSLINALNRSIKNGHPFILNHQGNDTRDYIHVKDAADIIYRVVKDNRHRGYIDVGTGTDLRVGDIVEKYRDLHPDLIVEYSKTNDRRGPTRSRANSFVSRSIIGRPFISLHSCLAQSELSSQKQQTAKVPDFPINRGA
jgi:nucleoside-diphosphate-sugar epimerase